MYFPHSDKIKIDNWEFVCSLKEMRGLPKKSVIRQIEEKGIIRNYFYDGYNWNIGGPDKNWNVLHTQDVYDYDKLVIPDLRIFSITNQVGKDTSLFKRKSDTAYTEYPYVEGEYTTFLDVCGSSLVDYLYPDFIRHNMDDRHRPDVSPDSKGRVIFDVYEWVEDCEQEFSMLICDTVIIK